MPFAAFEEGWKEFLRAKQLAPVPGVQLPQFKVVENEAQDEDRLEREALQSAGSERDVALGDLMRQRGRHAASIYYFDRARKALPDSVVLLNKLAQALMAAQRPQEAVPHLQYALAVAPDHSPSHASLGDVYRALGELEAARVHYEQAIQINPFNPVPHRFLADLYRERRDTEAARREDRATARLLGR
jgi:tetratricopeptide (TPR) repeat protein